MLNYQEIRFFKPFGNSKPLHFYLIQFTGALYMIYRLLSRDYSHLGFFQAEYRTYPRGLWHELFPVPLSYLTSFQFIYEFIPFPSPPIIKVIQFLIVLFSFFLLLGILPRLSAQICSILYIHVLGIMQSIGGEIDGGTLLVVLYLVLSISPSNYFYKLFGKTKNDELKNWPIFLLLIFVGCFYFFAGMNKLIDVGFQFPLTLHLENLGFHTIEKSIFLSSRNYFPSITSSSLFLNANLSVLAGFITLLCEIGFITIIFLPRYRFFLIFSMIFMHTLVYYSAAINFLGSSFILILCFDWNILQREITLVYDDDCGFCKNSLSVIKKFDWFNRVSLVPSYSENYPTNNLDQSRLNDEMAAVEENEEIYYGADAFEQVFSKVPLFWGLAILFKIPGVIYLARFIYKNIANNRHRLSSEGCDI